MFDLHKLNQWPSSGVNRKLWNPSQAVRALFREDCTLIGYLSELQGRAGGGEALPPINPRSMKLRMASLRP